MQLKTIFSQMESFFHGKSSGLDPLNSYLSIPILINSKDNIEATGIPTQSLNGKGAVFLIDSGIVGETAPMVNIFMENLKDQGFRKMLKISIRKIYRCLCRKFPWRRYEIFVCQHQKIIKSRFEQLQTNDSRTISRHLAKRN